MNRNLLKLYHRLPGALRSSVASVRGFYLSHYRYGRETSALVEEARQREFWTDQQWRSWEETRLSYILHRAATQVPYYREQWAARRRRGDFASWQYLENWPVLEKESLRENPRAFVAEDCDVRRMFHEHTSGTTGKSLSLWFNRETVRSWYALSEARWRGWYGVSRNDRWAILGGQLITSADQERPPFWVWNGALKQLYMSSYHLSPDLMPYYLDALKNYQVKYLLGYTSSLFELAQAVIKLDRRDLKMTVVITNAEPVFDYQRRVIEEAFQCPVRETYGMAEMVTAASECEENNMHLWPEAGRVEVLEGDGQAANGTTGEFVCTGLMTPDMPLIRYRVGDRGAVDSSSQKCNCARTLPLLGSLEGRSDDVLFTRDGRRVGRLDTAFKSELPVREAQIIQETLDRVRVRYVPSNQFTKADGDMLVDLLRERLGKIEVVLEKVEIVPRTSNGKFRAVICQLPAEQKEEFVREHRVVRAS